eukprot:4694213-Prymnesium_polylepis.1
MEGEIGALGGLAQAQAAHRGEQVTNSHDQPAFTNACTGNILPVSVLSHLRGARTSCRHILAPRAQTARRSPRAGGS